MSNMQTTLVLLITTILVSSMVVQNVWAPSAEPTFVGNSHFQNLPVLHPGESTKFIIKLWVDGPMLYDIKPLIDVYPTSASSHVKIEAETLYSLEPRTAGTFHITITSDPEIPLGKIFLSVYFVAKDNYGITMRGGWSDHGSTINVEQSQQIPDSLAIQLEQAKQNIEPAKNAIKNNDPPLKQIKSGSSLYDIKCRNDLLLIAKSHGDFPACVKPFSMLRLLDIGWGYIPFNFETKTDLLNTTITGGKIIGFKFDVQAASIVINLETTRDGSLTLTIPNALTSSMSWYKNNPSHGVLIDGQFFELDETITREGTTVIVPFKQGAKTIEIFGSHEHSVANCPVDESLDLIPVRFDQFGNPLRLVFFVESNSTAQICIRYSSDYDNHGSIPVADQLIVDYYNQNSTVSSDVMVAAEPSSVPLEIGSETFVLYTITAPSNADGVYWLPESQMCTAIPIVVWSDLPQVDSSKLTVIVGFHSCGPQMLTAKIVGFSGAIMDYKPAIPIGYRD